MLAFETRAVRKGNVAFGAACYMHGEAGVEDATILRDGKELSLPASVIQAIGNAIQTCRTLEQAGWAVDCNVFGAIALGGTYSPVHRSTYDHSLNRWIEYSQWLNDDGVTLAPSVMRMVQFGTYSGGYFVPSHTAEQLPVPNLYIQKLGPGEPIALTDAASIIRATSANIAAVVGNFLALHHSLPVLEYGDLSHNQQPVYMFRSGPG